ncbi:MAG: HAD-IA family hydrolase [Candidatus Binatus sp.]|uniref:HAD family hydrolase n=1 Tax=Candidatus Binatus sp. TaxID=2811406 RepID=UPI00271B932F|nr:HAD-IA family hydrolase [Candidatus Binatus sp.]MDO8433077.1 HAD-IA family hydrolase [Candidatus Binatus sp.]
MIDLVIFDADGVLFDSDESNVAYYNWIFAQMGELPLDRDEEIAAISYAATDVFKGRARGDADKLKRMHDLARTMDSSPFLRLLRPHLELRPYMIELKRRYKLGLATNRSATVPALIEHLGLGGIFDAVASARDKVRPKPAPDIIELCLERAGVSASRAVYVGDSQIDRVAAEAAGTHFVGVGRRIEHHRLIPNIGELPRTLENLMAALS